MLPNEMPGSTLLASSQPEQKSLKQQIFRTFKKNAMPVIATIRNGWIALESTLAVCTLLRGALQKPHSLFRQDVESTTVSGPQSKIHVALLYLRAPEMLDDGTLDGIALTLSQLVKLDMRILVLLDCDHESQSLGSPNASVSAMKESKQALNEQAERLTKAIGRHSPEGARMVTGAIEVWTDSVRSHNGPTSREAASIALPSLLLNPLKRNVIPIVPTMAYTPSGQLIHVTASSIMSALSTLLSGLSAISATHNEDNTALATSLDRIIVLEPNGGIPSKARRHGAHVFINLEQEFDEIDDELASHEKENSHYDGELSMHDKIDQHRVNLQMVKECLALLPPASSALIITPQEAAASSSQTTSSDPSIGTGTRRQRNTLIHNLLTNKPVVSSSLPAARMPSAPGNNGSVPEVGLPRATLLKRGMPVTIIPVADQDLGWRAPHTGKTSLSPETDPGVDLARLVYLIDDSFRRKLDVRHYLNRIQDRVAGIIVAGEYEGGAILTWEMPPSTNDPTRLVPYLDKFAVLSSSQGSAGVADIVFQAMVRTCFPNDVCWRSRKDNPVNKWYFERSNGTWQIPGTNWTMFWTGDGVVEDSARWNDYVGVCTAVQPSWADGKKPD